MATKTNSITSALINIQSKLKAPKNQRNTFGNYNYRSLEDITEAVKPLLAENNCTLTFTDNIEIVGERYYVCATATLKNDDGEISVTARAREPISQKGMIESQITGATSSYARKYAANGLFAIDDTKDADTDEYHKQTGGKAAPKTAPKKTASTSNSKASTDNEEEECRKYRHLIIQYAREHKMTTHEIETDYHVTNNSPLKELKRAYEELITPPDDTKSTDEAKSIQDEFAALDEQTPF